MSSSPAASSPDSGIGSPTPSEPARSYGATALTSSDRSGIVSQSAADGSHPGMAVTGSAFAVDLPSFQGPFDALLSMIANRQLELSEVALAEVTGEFVEYVRTLDLREDVDEVSSFVDVASILLEAKSASLLPHDESQELGERDLEALRERDLLFARLVQYRAFEEAAGDFSRRLAANTARYPHYGRLDDSVVVQAPDAGLDLSVGELAQLAAKAFADAPEQSVAVAQLHVPLVDLREQSRLVRERLSAADPAGSITFAELVHDAASTLEVVARFLAVLHYFRQGHLQYRQPEPFKPLELRWVPGDDDADLIG